MKADFPGGVQGGFRPSKASSSGVMGDDSGVEVIFQMLQSRIFSGYKGREGILQSQEDILYDVAKYIESSGGKNDQGVVAELVGRLASVGVAQGLARSTIQDVSSYVGASEGLRPTSALSNSSDMRFSSGNIGDDSASSYQAPRSSKLETRVLKNMERVRDQTLGAAVDFIESSSDRKMGYKKKIMDASLKKEGALQAQKARMISEEPSMFKKIALNILTAGLYSAFRNLKMAIVNADLRSAKNDIRTMQDKIINTTAEKEIRKNEVYSQKVIDVHDKSKERYNELVGSRPVSSASSVLGSGNEATASSRASGSQGSFVLRLNNEKGRQEGVRGRG